MEVGIGGRKDAEEDRPILFSPAVGQGDDAL